MLMSISVGEERLLASVTPSLLVEVKAGLGKRQRKASLPAVAVGAFWRLFNVFVQQLLQLWRQFWIASPDISSRKVGTALKPA